MKFFNKKINKLTFIIDDNTRWVIGNKLLSILKGPITILLLVKILSVENQGTWYAFTNLSAISIMADLGFLLLITQYVSHESSSLVICDDKINGDINNLSRLRGLIQVAFKLYAVVVPVAVTILCLAGVYYFSDSRVLTLWVIYSVISGLKLFGSLFLHIYQGFDKVKSVQKTQIISTFVFSFTIWISLFLGLNLWSLLLGQLLSSTYILWRLYFNKLEFWRNLLKVQSQFANWSYWKPELLGLQLKYAISWLSGFVIFNYAVPSAYKYMNPLTAGQLGVTLVLFATLNSLSYSPIIANLPKMNMLAAKYKQADLLSLFRTSLRTALLLFVAGNFTIVIVLTLWKSDRFLPLYLVTFWIGVNLSTFIVGCLSYYLRSHKEEPFFALSVINALVSLLLIEFYLKEGNLLEYGYLLMIAHYVLILPVGLYIYFRKRNNHLKNNTGDRS